MEREETSHGRLRIFQSGEIKRNRITSRKLTRNTREDTKEPNKEGGADDEVACGVKKSTGEAHGIKRDVGVRVWKAIIMTGAELLLHEDAFAGWGFGFA